MERQSRTFASEAIDRTQALDRRTEGATSMIAGERTRRVSHVSLAPAPLVALLAATLLGGAVAGAAITASLASVDTSLAQIPAAAPQSEPSPINVERRDRLGGP
jgi:hypothetical protein